jgi:DNA-binding protein H-NS
MTAIGANRNFSNVTREWLQARAIEQDAEIIQLRREVCSEREGRERLATALRQKDEAMGVLFERLAKAGVDCSNLFS